MSITKKNIAPGALLQPLDRKAGLYMKATLKKGRGVFCRFDIAKDEVLEITPAILLDKRETTHVDKSILNNYTFRVGEIAGLPNTDSYSCVVMGIQSFCNHDEKPNATIEWEETEGSVYYILRATRRIPKDTEICTTYGEGWFDDRD